jgi:aspartate aminotransferase-like enzyme
VPAPGRISPPVRVLMGPGPSDVPPEVLAALGAPTVGHLDPYFLAVMDEVSAWRIGLMGSGSNRRNVVTCLGALAAVLRRQGFAAVASDAVAAAEVVWRSAAE